MSEIERLLDIMRALRDPETGCPWDKKQTFASIAPYTIEEAYEVADAIEQQDYTELRKELGDLLLQVVYHSQIATEQELFNFNDVVTSISDKMVHRHPHVFGDEQGKAVEEVKQTWENLKAQERADKNQHGVLADIPKNLPALTRAYKIQKRAANVGFDWSDIQGVLDKLKEELVEVEQAMQQNNAAAIEEEIGDLLFSCVNLARHQKINPEDALRAANLKFMQRFEQIEQLVQADNKTMQDCSLEELDQYWQQVKQQ